jgi:peptidoglycan/LPS O-acetylase OafA/YrhL
MTDVVRTASQVAENNALSRIPPADTRPRAFRFGHFPQLDGFRGLAVLLVVLGHFLECAGYPPIPTAIGHALATTGVFLFFVLSGFLITGLLQREKTERGRIDLKRFYIRRALRLAPALLAFLIVIVLLLKLHLVENVRPYEIVACLLYARNFFGKSMTLSHIWSLSLEEQFYLCWPGLYRLFNRTWALPVTVAITALIAIWRGFAIHFSLFDYGRGIFYMRPYFRFDSILIGACLALALATNDRFLERAVMFSKVVPAAFLWFSLAVWTYFGESLSKSMFLTLQMILIAAILCQLILEESPLSQVLFKNAVLRYFGKISYSLYLWQQIFLVVKLPSWGVLREFPLNVVMSVVLAMISFHFLETPALRLKQHFE